MVDWVLLLTGKERGYYYGIVNSNGLHHCFSLWNAISSTAETESQEVDIFWERVLQTF
jgi:hypothetical protein